MANTLLKYAIGDGIEAFSTTRISPVPITPPELDAMGNYAAFNVTHYCGDAPERVARNRRWLCNELGVKETNLWLPHQTHTANTLCVDEEFLNRTEEEQSRQLENVDALITKLTGHCVGVSTADCVPLLILDTKHRVVAAVHAGWRGTVRRIAWSALQVMQSKYGTAPADCRVVIGPSISPDAYEVGDELKPQFLSAGFPETIFSSRKQADMSSRAKLHLDLWAANVFLLENAGVPLSNILISGICTYLHADTFFSARKLGIESGRIFTGIVIRK